MRSMFSQILAVTIIVFSSQAVYADGVFKWKDARGNTQYGDEPPANAKLDKFKMPEIMVVDGFKDQWKPLEGDKPKAIAAKKIVAQQPIAIQATPVIYTKLVLVAPRDNQIIKSGFNGEVSAMISLKPPLKKGHQIVFELDGKAVAKSKSRINNFSNLSGGTHTVAAKIVDHRGNDLMASSPVAFSVVRTKANKKRNTK